jgi:hypothetical protein
MPQFDALHLSIALGPLAVYLLLVGMINLSTRPFLTTGARDVAAIGVAISGFIAAGPMELFLPEAAADRFGPFVWLLLLAFYGLCLTLLVLMMRPRLVIYNANSEQLHSILSEVIHELGAEARWAGDSLVVPQLGVQLHVEPFGAMRNAQLVSAGPRQSYTGWRRLELALSSKLKATTVARNPHGYALIAIGVLLIGMITYSTMSDPTTIVQGLDDLLRR